MLSREDALERLKNYILVDKSELIKELVLRAIKDNPKTTELLIQAFSELDSVRIGYDITKIKQCTFNRDTNTGVFIQSYSLPYLIDGIDNIKNRRNNIVKFIESRLGHKCTQLELVTFMYNSFPIEIISKLALTGYIRFEFNLFDTVYEYTTGESGGIPNSEITDTIYEYFLDTGFELEIGKNIWDTLANAFDEVLNNKLKAKISRSVAMKYQMIGHSIQEYYNYIGKLAIDISIKSILYRIWAIYDRSILNFFINYTHFGKDVILLQSIALRETEKALERINSLVDKDIDRVANSYRNQYRVLEFISIDNKTLALMDSLLVADMAYKAKVQIMRHGDCELDWRKYVTGVI